MQFFLFKKYIRKIFSHVCPIIFLYKYTMETADKNLERAESDIQIQNLIYTIRGKHVIIDRDLATLYKVDTKRLNEQVKRNSERFPDDFMFQLSIDEFNNWKSQFATSNSSKMALRKRPYAFTECGIAMLSSVLHSRTAIEVNIRIMRTFVALRNLAATNSKIFHSLYSLEKRQYCLEAHQEKTDNMINEILDRINNRTPEQGVFYDGQIFDAYTFVSDLIRNANHQIIIIDNYIDDTVLKLLDKRNHNVQAIIYTNKITPKLELDIAKHNAQYAPINIKAIQNIHDRFLITDDMVYHIGASIKDLGKKLFGFSLMKTLKVSDILKDR